MRSRRGNTTGGLRQLAVGALMLCCCSLPFTVQGQTLDEIRAQVRKGSCTPPAEDETLTRGTQRRLPAINKEWDAGREYRQMVVLLEFSDESFDEANNRELYDKMLNEHGYKNRHTKGCLADYFREQSGGLFNVVFDIYGPVKVSQVAKPNANATASTRNYGRDALREATQAVLDSNPDVDYSQYDWNNDGQIEQVVYIYAGTPGNQGESSYGYIWPNTSSFTALTTPDGKTISNYSCSGEHWANASRIPLGIGTIAHEYSHCLGLPDVYMTDGTSDNIVMDTWDLMDGGNFVNYGFCPPNYTPLEKILLGWLEPEELTEAVTIEGLKPGKVYKVADTENDYYLLETRLQDEQTWDEGVPGQGLLVYHVNYKRTAWANNQPNTASLKRYDLVHADGMNYYDWVKKCTDEGLGSYQPGRKGSVMNFWALSTSPYPFVPESGDAVTAFDVLPEKALTNIRLNDDGTVSFDFKGGATALNAVRDMGAAQPDAVYDLSGRQVRSLQPGQLYIVRSSNGILRKMIK